MLMKWTEIFMGQSQPPGPSFPHDFIPRVLWRHAQALKNPVSGLGGCYVPREAAKRGDTLTCTQHSSTTVGKSRGSPDRHHQYGEMAVRSFAELIRHRSIKRRQSGSSSAGANVAVQIESIPAPTWAALSLTLCTQHCVPVSHLRVPHQNSSSTLFCTA